MRLKSQEITSDKTTTRTKRNTNKNGLLSFLSSSITRVYLFFVDIVSIIKCFWTVLMLLYFSFVKDFVKILLYAAEIYINRFKWLCRIARVNKFRNCKQGEADIPKCMPDESSPDEVFKGSPGIINVATCEVNSEQVLTATPQILACEAITPRPQQGIRDVCLVKKAELQHIPSSFDQQKMPIDIQDKYYPLYITEVKSPHELYFKWGDDMYTHFYKKLQIAINTYYNEKHGCSLFLKEEDITNNIPCAALSTDENQWYRAVILENMSDDSVKVRSADSGNTHIISKSLLRYMHMEFLKLPRQAFRCGIANLCPPKNTKKWDKNASKVIKRLSTKTRLLGKLEYTVEGIHYFRFFNPSDGIYLNEALTDYGLADYSYGEGINDHNEG